MKNARWFTTGSDDSYHQASTARLTWVLMVMMALNNLSLVSWGEGVRPIRLSSSPIRSKAEGWAVPIAAAGDLDGRGGGG